MWKGHEISGQRIREKGHDTHESAYGKQCVEPFTAVGWVMHLSTTLERYKRLRDLKVHIQLEKATFQHRITNFAG